MKLRSIIKNPWEGRAKSRLGFTLTEVVIVMLIISVIVAISIKLTKAKLDNITSYTYYSAYTTINSVTREMLKDFDATDNDYTTSYHFINFNPVWATTYYTCKDQWIYSGSQATRCNMCSGSMNLCSATGIKRKNYNELNPIPFWVRLGYVECPGKYKKRISYLKEPFFEHFTTYTSSSCSYSCGSETSETNCGEYYFDPSAEKCPNYWNGNKINPIVINGIELCTYDEDDEPDPPTPIPPGSTCTPTSCTGGNDFDLGSCSCVCNKTAPVVIPCGKEWSETQCQLVDKSPWPPVCPSGQEFNPKEDICGCVPIAQAIPRTGANYCKLFVSYSNTSQLTEDAECTGDAINTNETEFFNKEPDIILRNGMYLYNVSQDPIKIDILDGNSRGKTYTKTDGTEVDIDEWGYTVYIDIDGKSGDGKLWEDVYPFYVTLSGYVVPAYDTENPEAVGGDSKFHLQTSVYDEYQDGTGRHVEWIKKSKSFKESACTMGYVKSATNYCSGFNQNANCENKQHDCRLKTIMPVKFFQ